MKRLLIFLLSGFITLSVTAQTITLAINGNNRNKNLQVVIDGTSYYSNSVTNGTNNNTTVNNKIILSNQQLGSHTIAVYRGRKNNNYRNGTNATQYGNAVYSNTFQLRQGYDMEITINGNGRVTFSETRIRNKDRRLNDDDRQYISPMDDAAFNQLLQTVRSKWLQSGKIVTERDAFLNTSNYFTTEQVRQLLQLISSEANKLSLAKLAYPKVVDPANFTQAYSVFNSIASRNEMDVFIRNNPNNNTDNQNRDNNNNGYKTPMADYQFNQLLQSINAQYNQTGKYNIISNALYNNYFSTSQVRQLLSVINNQNERFALAKQSYLRVTDAANFSSLYDLFYSQYLKNELNNYVIQNGGNGTNVQYNTRIAMDGASFSQVLQKVSNHFFPWDKVRDAKDAFNNTSYYFSTSQIRQILTVIAGENDKLELAKLAWSRVSDPAYFTQLFDLFSSQANRDELNAYIQSHPY